MGPVFGADYIKIKIAVARQEVCLGSGREFSFCFIDLLGIQPFIFHPSSIIIMNCDLSLDPIDLCL